MEYNTQKRQNTLIAWLQNIFPKEPINLRAIAGDASFRKYSRLTIHDKNYIVMDAPPESEPIEHFIKIAALLKNNKVNTPTIYEYELKQGFILLEDFGNLLLHTSLQTASLEETNSWYHKAFAVIAKMQNSNTSNLAAFDKNHMLKEWNLFTEWFLQAYLKLEFSKSELGLLQETFNKLAASIEAQPKALIHRDFHSKNILITKQELGILDFQDAMLGSVFYDLVSLIKDCYINFPEIQIKNWFEAYYKELNYNFDCNPYKEFELCGIQRHCKALGIFTRLDLLYNRNSYLQYIPRTLTYILEALPKYQEYRLFLEFLQEKTAKKSCVLP